MQGHVIQCKAMMEDSALELDSLLAAAEAFVQQTTVADDERG